MPGTIVGGHVSILTGAMVEPNPLTQNKVHPLRLLMGKKEKVIIVFLINPISDVDLINNYLL
jgi:hypothetical protein